MYTFSLSKRVFLRPMERLNLDSLWQVACSETSFLLISTIVGYALGYFYLVFMGRTLGPESFGVFGSLVAIFYLACLVGQALREAIATNVAEIKARYGETNAIRAYLKLGVRLSLLCLLPVIVVYAVSQQIASFFHLSSIWPVILLGFSVCTALILDVLLGLFQGLQKFMLLSIIGYLVSQGLKLFLGIAFVWIGWDLAGAIAALLASTAIAVMTGLVAIGGALAGEIHHRGPRDIRLGPVLIPTLILAIFMAMPTSIDVMLVTHIFSGTEAGIYNAVATLGKVVIFLPMAVSLVLLPKVTENHTLGLGSRRILIRSLIYTLVLSGAVAFIYLFFHGAIIDLFFGQSYAEAGDLIGWYGIAMLLFVLNFVLIHYSLATRNLILILIADLITVVEIVVITLIHESLLEVIWILIFGNLSIFSLSLLVLVFNRFRFSRNGIKG